MPKIEASTPVAKPLQPQWRRCVEPDVAGQQSHGSQYNRDSGQPCSEVQNEDIGLQNLWNGIELYGALMASTFEATHRPATN